ncbi:putative ribosomal protein L18e/L15P [Helianthus debilis subsp. tardiflorus]
MHYHRILFDKYHPSFFGKVGMRYFHRFRNKFYCSIVNVDKIWSMVLQEVKDKASADKVPVVDVTQLGYFKVLGEGMVVGTSGYGRWWRWQIKVMVTV